MYQRLAAHRQGLLLLIYPLLILWFKYLEKIIQPRYFTESWIDQYIPFVPVFIVPYTLWFVLIGWSLNYYYMRSRSDFVKLCFFIYTGMAICLTLYMIFPNGQNLRPHLGESFFENLVAFFYSIDTPTNSAPSIHVINAIAVHAAVLNAPTLNQRPWLRRSSVLMMLLIILSTVLVKQHAIIDTALGLLLAGLLYVGVYKIPWQQGLKLQMKTMTTAHKETDSLSVKRSKTSGRRAGR